MTVQRDWLDQGAELDETTALSVIGELRAELEASREELVVLEKVSFEILSVHDVDQVLLSISHKTMGLLDADMAGVLMHEGDQLIMRSLTGNRSVETARLRMRRGQGLAGRVFETGEPCKVDSYLEARTITHDFDPLARLESTRSALAAPMQVRGEIIGVLEVWRRRRSLFSERHVRRLVALANLATIAIENARLYDSQQDSVRELASAQDSLSRQLQSLRQSANLQRALIQLLLEGEGLQAITRTIATQVGGRAAVFSDDFEPLAYYPRDLAVDVVEAELRRVVGGSKPRSGSLNTVLPDGGGRLTAQAVQAGVDRLGWFCLISEHAATTTMEMAVGEGALGCALSQLEQRAANQARCEARDEILWDLLEGSAEHRQAAFSRAKRMHIDLSRPQRVLLCVLDELDDAVDTEGWDTTRVERLRRDVRSVVQRILSSHGDGELVSLRGDSIVALVAGNGNGNETRKVIAEVQAGIARLVAGLGTTCGLSAAHDSAFEYHRAFNEAQIAIRAARRMGREKVAVYDELGVVRLLVAPDESADLGQFVDEVIGPLIEHDSKHGAMLVDTLRAYFDADCSQQLAAKRLFVHHKTLRYRLDRIQALTDLDLRRHEDRLRADLALKIHHVIAMNDGTP